MMQIYFMLPKINSAQQGVNPLRPSDEIWHHETSSTLIQLMACHLFGTKPLPKSMLIYCHLDAQEKNAMKS